MAEIFKLPTSSLDEVIKIIQAYSSEKEGSILSLDDLSKSTGMAKTVVSANNGFLVQTGIITEGNKKSSTEVGRNLGRAYASKIEYEISRLWNEIINESDFLTRMISAVRIRNGMDRTSLLNHIVYSSGLKDNKQSRTGANAIIDLFKSICIFEENDGKITVLERTLSSDSNYTESKKEISVNKPETENFQSTSNKGNITINININCNVNDLDGLSEKLKNLLDSLSD